jgi:hypothetical protein
MSLSMYQASVPVFVQLLGSLSAVVDKAIAHATAKKFDPSVLLGTRLFPDMLPLVKQFQIATDHAKGAPARLAGQEPPKFADDEKTLEEIKARLTKTIDYLKSLTPAQIDGSEGKEIVLPLRTRTLTFTGQAYLLHFAMPNFYFHVTTAYAILRQAGVEIGKSDFIGQIPA